nr:hypothetical protein [Tanacetum cinerariifolium]
MVRDCKELVEKIQNCVLDWKNKSLSIAGRLQLIRSVIGSMNVFSASVFILPNQVLLDIEQIMRSFLWCPSDSSRGKAKVAWDVFCLSKDEGGLGIRRLAHFNSALMEGVLTWPQDLMGKYPSLSICTAPTSTENDQLVWRLNDGTVKSFSVNQVCLSICTAPTSTENDQLVWRLNDGTVKSFSVNQVWCAIRPRDSKVVWYGMVWFHAYIPRHAFNLWLIIKRKLKTQDMVCVWDVSPNLGNTCSLCEVVMDSHEHLFFKYSFADAVWSHMKTLVGLDQVSHDVYDVITHFGMNAKRKSTHVVIAKMVLATSTYFIWQERNWRLFKKSKSLTRTMNYQPVIAGNQTNPSVGFQDKFNAEKEEEEINQQYMIFPLWYSGSTNPKNNDGDAAFDGKEHDFDARKPDQGNKMTRPRKRLKERIILNLSHASGTIVPTVGQNSSNSTNPFSATGPSNTTASPTHGKSSFIDASQLSDDPDMAGLEDITYSNDKNDVGAEADFNNMETSITVSPIPTTRIHKDHPVLQIIGDLSSTTQTRSMSKVVKDQGGSFTDV